MAQVLRLGTLVAFTALLAGASPRPMRAPGRPRAESAAPSRGSAIRSFDKPLLVARIDDARGYLLRMFDPERMGVHKFYHPETDELEHELHTIYTASTALTLLKLHARSHAPELLDQAKRAATFLLSMQDRTRGGFQYSVDIDTNKRDERLIVGTTSKTIFTLLELNAVTGDRRYLEAATKAADWLVTMQRADGSVRSYLKRDGDRWMASGRESLLYTGQTLSALSRTYAVTREARHLDAAASTAMYLVGKVTAHGCRLGDDYRPPNAISSSWVVMSLLDFVRATNDAHVERLMMHCADELVSTQLRRGDDPFRVGRFAGVMSSSGNGWVAEVLSEVNQHCRTHGLPRCERFSDSVIAAVRLLLQHTYEPDNASFAKAPDRAKGGLFWSPRDCYVRTDSVCHATNAYLGIVDQLPEGPLAELVAGSSGERVTEVADVEGDADD